MPVKSRIKALSEEYFDEVVEIRRHLHQHPELSYQEFETSAFIRRELEKLGIPFKNIFHTGIVGEIKGHNPERFTVALRADIDALPIQEKNSIEYKSQNEGIMHACGHDVHTASLLGALKILNELKDSWEGTVKFIFQPAEEKLPGGAKQLIEEGVLNDPRPDLIIGQHVYPDLPVGTIGFKPGAYMASSDELFLTIKGKGGHGGMPHKINDTVLSASQVISSLHANIHRYAPADIPTVLSFGRVIADGATNIIPDEVRIDGTFRTMDEEWRAKAHRLITNIAQSVAKSLDTECLAEIKKGYPVLYNDEKVSREALRFSGEYLGEHMIKLLEKRMTAEDFAYYTQEIPGIFFRLGTGNKEKGIQSPLHSSTFNIDEQALRIGMGHLAWLTFQFLDQKRTT